MKIRRIIKRGVSLVATFAIVLTMLLNVGVLEPKAATSTIKINGVSLTVDIGVDGSAAYFKNGDTSSTGATGTESVWNAKYENMGSWTRLTLKNLDIDVNGIAAIEASTGLFVNLEGDNVIDEVSDTNSTTLITPGYNYDLSFSGSGSLTVNDPKTNAINTILCSTLQLTDTASVKLNIGAKGDTQQVVKVNEGLNSKGSSNLEINVAEGGSDCYGIYTENTSPIAVSESANLTVNIADGDTTKDNTMMVGIYAKAANANLFTSGKVSINVGRGYNCKGIYSNEVVVRSKNVSIDVAQGNNQSHGIETFNNGVTVEQGGAIDIKVAQNSSSISGNLGKYGIYAKNGVAVTGVSKININTGNSTSVGYGIYTSNGVSMSGGSSSGGPVIDIDMGAGKDNYGIYLHAGSIETSGYSKVDINIADNTGFSGNSNGINSSSSTPTNLIMSDNSEMNIVVGPSESVATGISIYNSIISMTGDTKLTVNCGNAASSEAVYASAGVNMEDNSVMEAVASEAGYASRGVYTSYLTMTDNAKMTATAADVTGTGMAESYGLYMSQKSSISGDAIIKATAGTSSKTAYALAASVTFEIKGGTVEAIGVDGSTNAFKSTPTLSDPAAFLVKAGARSSSATSQDNTAKTEASTYTDNEYVLIKAIKTIDRVDLSDIDKLVHGETADTTAKSSTEGVASKISVSWAPAGDIVGGTEYTGTITIKPVEGYVFASDVEIYYGSEKLSSSLQADGSVKATYKQTPDKVDLVSVEDPEDVTGVKNGTALKDISLPEKTDITTALGADEAEIAWDLTSVNYDPTSKEEQTFTVSGRIVAPEYVYTSNVNLEVSIKVTVKAASQEPTTTATEATTQAPTTTATEVTTQTSTTAATTTQAPSTGSMTDTEAPTTAATTTEAPDNSDANVKTGDDTPLTMMLMLMVVAGIGMIVVGKKREEE